jgi:hypothetical protein
MDGDSRGVGGFHLPRALLPVIAPKRRSRREREREREKSKLPRSDGDRLCNAYTRRRFARSPTPTSSKERPRAALREEDGARDGGGDESVQKRKNIRRRDPLTRFSARAYGESATRLRPEYYSFLSLSVAP